MPEIEIREVNGKEKLQVFGIPGKDEPVTLGLRTLEARKILEETAANFQIPKRKLIKQIREAGPIEI